MCEWCNEIEGFGHYGVGATRPRLNEAKGCCSFYRDSCRDYYIESRSRWFRDELRRIPKREPDDPRYRLRLGEGLSQFYFRYDGDLKDWYFLKYLPSRRRRIYYANTSGKGADAPEERASRGVEVASNGWPKLYDFKKEVK